MVWQGCIQHSYHLVNSFKFACLPALPRLFYVNLSSFGRWQSASTADDCASTVALSSYFLSWMDDSRSTLVIEWQWRAVHDADGRWTMNDGQWLVSYPVVSDTENRLSRDSTFEQVFEFGLRNENRQEKQYVNSFMSNSRPISRLDSVGHPAHNLTTKQTILNLIFSTSHDGFKWKKIVFTFPLQAD